MLTKCLILFSLTVLLAEQGSANQVQAVERIIGGEEVSIKEAPWQAGIITGLGILTRNGCGGVIYSESLIITAASCVVLLQITPGLVKVRVGTSARNTGGTEVGVSKIVLHPEYSPLSLPPRLDYNIALLQLAKPLVLSDKVQTIKLATESPKDGELATATGWGLTNKDNLFSASAVLKSFSAPILDHAKCAEANPGAKGITEWTICTSLPNKGGCFNDEGGPLVVNNTLVGVFSLTSCGKYPDVYANVAKLRSWIEKKGATLKHV